MPFRRSLIPFRWARVAGLAIPLAGAATLADETPIDAKSGGRPEIQESGDRAVRIFDELDQDGDGKLTADEIPAERRAFFDHLVRVGDKDKDGRLTRDEFAEGTKPVTSRPKAGEPEGSPSQPAPGTLRPVVVPGQIFQRLDRNGDGKLTLDELPEQARERFKPLFDRSGKSELSRDEFSGMAERFLQPGPGNGNPEQFMKRMDRNGDGQLALDEVPEFLRPRMTAALAELGRDGKGTMSFEEFLRHAGPILRPRPPAGDEGMIRAGDSTGPAFFRRLDRNGDGKLSRAEVERAVQVFDDLDADKDGTLALPEFFGGIPAVRDARPASPEPPRVPKPASPEEPDRKPRVVVPAARPGAPQGANATNRTGGAFRRLDTDGDGKVSRDEAPRNLKRNFQRLDANGDGFLDPDELRKALLDLRGAGKTAGS